MAQHKAEMPTGDLEAALLHKYAVAARLASLLGLIAKAQHQTAVVLEPASLSAREH